VCAWRRLRSSALRWHALALAVVLLAAFAFRVRQINALSPYLGHIDEGTWTRIAMNMRKTGDLNPHRFRYPSLPVYLMAAGVSVGLVRAQLDGEARGAKDFESVVRGYYSVPSALEVPKYLFTLASVVALGLTGLIGYLVTRRRPMLWLAPLVASLAPTYLNLSWRYMNVDILGAMFVVATIAYLVWARARYAENGTLANGGRHALLLGILCGLAEGSKYTLFPSLVPCVLFFFFFERQRFFLRTFTLGAVAVATFFLTTPFALVEPERFVNDILKEAHHYATGHFTNGQRTRTVARGLPMLRTYVESFAGNFGYLPLLVAAAGAVTLFRRDARTAALIYAFPVTYVAFMSLQQVFFPRNTVALLLFVSISLAMALCELPPALAAFISRSAPHRNLRWLHPAAFGAVTLLVLVGTPWTQVAAAYALDIEPRNDATRFIKKNIPRETQVLVDPSLDMDLRPLEKTHSVVELTPRRLRALKRAHARTRPPVVIVSAPRQTSTYARAVGRARLVARFTSADARVEIIEPREPAARRPPRHPDELEAPLRKRGRSRQ
jgi:hypothetical protein